MVAAVRMYSNFRIRLYPRYDLIFFVCLLFSACTEKSSTIKIIWTNARPTGISIPQKLTGEVSETPGENVIVRMVSQQPVAMLGNYTIHNNQLIFEPLVPFTRGLRYEILVDGNVVGEIEIPKPDDTDAPVLLNIYPTQDTLPENLLKIYLHFSRTMREGVSAQHITVIKNNKDTLLGTFLDLQPELWNEDRTRLTLWLDPGRIKRDLIPNKVLGNPLQEGNRYTLIIDDRWTDTQGLALAKPHQKEFTVATRDSLSPDPKRWMIHAPIADSRQALRIELKTAHDYSLLLSALQIEDDKKKVVIGKWETADEEKGITFIPQEAWKAGSYFLSVETKLEDLAGNNIERLFDKDLERDSETISQKEVVSVRFDITP